MDRAYLSSPQEVLAHFRVDQERGLSSDQVAKNRLAYGSNGMVQYKCDILSVDGLLTRFGSARGGPAYAVVEARS